VSGITTHVLDISLGRPAAGVPVVLERSGGTSQWIVIGHGDTDNDGRLRTLTPDAAPSPGAYRLVFDTRKYFERRGVLTFYPSIAIVFEVTAGTPHYHVPLVLSPFGYSTYRGS
jgi:5-hydroxyisourate hydrolase